MEDSSDCLDADELHSRGQELMGVDDVAAIAYFQQAIELQADKAESYYNLGLIHKYRGEWEASLRCNEQSIAIEADNEAANWNLAIAATALREWSAARLAWKRLGLEIPGQAGAIEANFGDTPVRLDPDDRGEVVWGKRICPVRARIHNIPFPESGYFYGDVVLHDGAGTGVREWQGRSYPVFNELELWQRSGFRTFRYEVEAATPEEVQQLAQSFSEVGAVEDWTRMVRVLCRQCSEGTVHEECDVELEKQESSWLQLAVAARDPASLMLVEEWAAKIGRAIRPVHEAESN